MSKDRCLLKIFTQPTDNMSDNAAFAARNHLFVGDCLSPKKAIA